MDLLKKLTNRYYYLSTIITIVGLIWISNITACECNKDQDRPIKEEIIEEESGEKGNGSLVMTLTETNLVGPNKTAEVILKLSNKNKPATLKDFMLQVSFSEEGNDAGCQIKYDIYKHEKATLKKVSSVRENLTRLTTLEKLSPDDEPIKLNFTFNPKRNVTQLSATFQLLDAQGKPIQKGTLVTWKEKEENQSINLVLERLTPENLQDRDRRIELKITNQGTKKIRAGEAKLKITRIEGDYAMVDRALPTAVPNVYELALGELEPGTEKSTIETLTIIPGTDIGAKLNFQLVANNKPIEDDKVVITTWKAGVILALEHIKYDIINQEITYKVTNSGTMIPKNLKLEYSTTTPGIKLDGEELVPRVKKTNDLASLHIAPRSSVETHVLGKLDLNKNKNANFEFKLVYEGGYTTTQLHTFNIEGVDLYIAKLDYNPVTGMVTYNIKNRGTTKATDVKLQYSNTSDEKENPEGRTVLLEDVTTAIINLGDIAENNKEMGDRQLAIDFKYADKATFEFNVLYNETLITQETKIETFEARPVRLKLVPTTPLNLIGAHQEVRFKIQHDPQSRPLTNIDISKLELAVINELDNEAYFWHTDNKEEDLKGLAVNKLIDDIGNELILHIETGSAKEAEFILELTYKRLPITNTSPSHITWKEATLAIQESSDFVNDNTTTFKLKNLNTVELIDPKSIIIQLVSNNTAEFTLLKSDNSEAGSSTNLSQLIGDNLLRPNTPTNPIQFKLTNAQGRYNAAITIIAKRGNTELAKQTVRWEAQPISMQIKTITKRFKDQDIIDFSIQNNGPSTRIDKIRIYLTNNQGVKFKLTTNAKNITGDKIGISLKDILNLDKLEKGTIVYFSLGLADNADNNPNNTYVAQLVLKIQDDDRLLDTDTLVWVNNEELASILVNLQREMDIYIDNFLVLRENITKQISEGNDDPLNFYKNIDQLSTNRNSGQSLQSEIEEGLQNIEEQCKDIDKQDYPMTIDSLKSRLEQVLTNLKKLNTEIDNLIIKSLNHAKEQIEKLAKETETTSNQDVTSVSTNTDKMEGWLSILTIVADGKIVLEAKEIANNIIKELEENKNKPAADKIKNITNTPERRKETQHKLHTQATKTARQLFSEDVEENSNKSTGGLFLRTNSKRLRHSFPHKSTPGIFSGTHFNSFMPLRPQWGTFPDINSNLYGNKFPGSSQDK